MLASDGPATELGQRGDTGEAQSSHPLEDDGMIESDADPLDTDVEDADLFLGDGEDEPGELDAS